MKLAILAITENGEKLAFKLKNMLKKCQIDIFLSEKIKSDKDVIYYCSTLKKTVGNIFNEYDGLIFIMALGIVVRVIAPYLQDKRFDPAVVTLDETGKNVISTLSGHLGGANRLTEKIASLLDAKPVVTTATDCHGKLAFDLLAEELNCTIIPFKNLKFANAALVNNRQVNLFTDLKINKKLADHVNLLHLSELINHAKYKGFPVIISNQDIDLKGVYLQLIPRNIIIGIGCRKGVGANQVEEAVMSALKKLNLRWESIKKIATIDLKSQEEGILKFADKIGVGVEIISREEIKKADFKYTSSEFVKKCIGVGGVSEPAAILSARNGRLLLGKTIKNKVTVAVVEEGK